MSYHFLGDLSAGSIKSHVGLPALDVSLAFPQATPASIFPPSGMHFLLVMACAADTLM